MIKKYNQFLNEGLIDKMEPKSKEEILNTILKDSEIVYGVKEEQLENFHKNIKYLLDNDYIFDHKDDFNVLWFNYKGNNGIYVYMNAFTKFNDLKDMVKSNKNRFNLTESINEKRNYKLTIKDSQELNDFLIHVIENMDNEPNLLRSAYARIGKILLEIKKGNYTKNTLPFLFISIYNFIDGNRNVHDLRLWSDKLIELDPQNYDALLNIINDYNHLLNKLKSKGKIEKGEQFNIKSWAFEEEGIEPIGEKKSYKDYCDFGCGYIATYLAENPDINVEDFEEYITIHNKADRDMGELQDISKEEIERLGKEYKKQTINEEFKASFFGLNDIPEVFKRMGFDETSAKILKKLAIRAFKYGGDESLIDFFRETTGQSISNISKGRYSFEPVTNENKKEEKEKSQKKDELKYLSEKERDRLTDDQKKYLVNKRKNNF
jgi:hypothetical protein